MQCGIQAVISAFSARAGTSHSRIEIGGLTGPDMQSRLEALESWYMTPEQTAARIAADHDKYGYLVKLTGTRLE